MTALFVLYDENEHDQSSYETIDRATAEIRSWLESSRENMRLDGYWNEPGGTWGVTVERIVEGERVAVTCDECGVEVGQPHEPSCDDYLPDEPDRPFESDVDYMSDYVIEDSPTLAADLAVVLRTRPAVWAELQRLLGGAE